jgi:hypothetical protein
MQQLLRHREILAGQAVKFTAAWHIILKLRRGGARLRTHSRSAGQKQRQERHAVEISGLGQLAVPDDVRMPREPSPPEIHQEKREIVEHIGTGNLVIELDAIEQSRSPV